MAWDDFQAASCCASSDSAYALSCWARFRVCVFASSCEFYTHQNFPVVSASTGNCPTYLFLKSAIYVQGVELTFVLFHLAAQEISGTLGGLGTVLQILPNMMSATPARRPGLRGDCWRCSFNVEPGFTAHPCRFLPVGRAVLTATVNRLNGQADANILIVRFIPRLRFPLCQPEAFNQRPQRSAPSARCCRVATRLPTSRLSRALRSLPGPFGPPPRSGDVRSIFGRKCIRDGKADSGAKSGTI